ncbi:hypothetical protein SLEP1_g3358 [Rubroshorea leprosula]|uniref:Uncharacterized protein n=1 Tax=Rubroshorea leprosula TaxID=152421 RepID=A0AAV5HQV7_9ROSI|nr:hypothetical protein SLEP1_g3358 [Rubroshorea leprosula]
MLGLSRPQNPNPETRQTPCTRDRVPRMHKARNLSKSHLTIQTQIRYFKINSLCPNTT